MTRILASNHQRQQFLARNEDGYCGLGGTGVACPVSLFAPDGAD